MWCQHAGYDPAVVKAKAVVEAREPKDAAEVRSFLGLVDFKARFTFQHSISTLTPTCKEWRTSCVGSGTATIV